MRRSRAVTLGACATVEQAGHRRIVIDITLLDPEHPALRAWRPPCPTPRRSRWRGADLGAWPPALRRDPAVGRHGAVREPPRRGAGGALVRAGPGRLVPAAVGRAGRRRLRGGDPPAPGVLHGGALRPYPRIRAAPACRSPSRPWPPSSGGPRGSGSAPGACGDWTRTDGPRAGTPSQRTRPAGASPARRGPGTGSRTATG